jgi:hypothetical protein
MSDMICQAKFSIDNVPLVYLQHVCDKLYSSYVKYPEPKVEQKI